MVASGYGCTILPELALPVEAGDRDGICVVPFTDPPPVRTAGLAWRRTSPRRGEFVAFGRVVVAALGKPPLGDPSGISEREHALVGEVLQERPDVVRDFAAIRREGRRQIVNDRAHRRLAVAPLEDLDGDLIGHQHLLRRQQDPDVARLVEAQPDAARERRHGLVVDLWPPAHGCSGRNAPSGIRPGVT
jgi:hypothetical protein